MDQTQLRRLANHHQTHSIIKLTKIFNKRICKAAENMQYFVNDGRSSVRESSEFIGADSRGWWSFFEEFSVVNVHWAVSWMNAANVNLCQEQSPAIPDFVYYFPANVTRESAAQACFASLIFA